MERGRCQTHAAASSQASRGDDLRLKFSAQLPSSPKSIVLGRPHITRRQQDNRMHAIFFVLKIQLTRKVVIDIYLSRLTNISERLHLSFGGGVGTAAQHVLGVEFTCTLLYPVPNGLKQTGMLDNSTILAVSLSHSPLKPWCWRWTR